MFPIVVDATRRSCRERARPARLSARLNFSSTSQTVSTPNRKTDHTRSDKNSGMSIGIARITRSLGTCDCETRVRSDAGLVK